jgi:hypothetical protein
VGFQAFDLDYSQIANEAFPHRQLKKHLPRPHLVGTTRRSRPAMLQDWKIKLWAAAIAASGGSFAQGAPEYVTLIAITVTVLRSFAQAIRRPLPASWHERCQTELRALRGHLQAGHGAHERNA